MVEQSVPADSVSALRESALAAARVRSIFTNLIDGKSVGARNTLDVLDPATGELLAKVPDIERDGMDAAFAAARRAWSSVRPRRSFAAASPAFSARASSSSALPR